MTRAQETREATMVAEPEGGGFGSFPDRLWIVETSTRIYMALRYKPLGIFGLACHLSELDAAGSHAVHARKLFSDVSTPRAVSFDECRAIAKRARANGLPLDCLMLIGFDSMGSRRLLDLHYVR